MKTEDHAPIMDQNGERDRKSYGKWCRAVTTPSPVAQPAGSMPTGA